MQSFPCQHSAEVILKDGRTASNLNSYEIYSVVSNLAIDKINPNEEKWDADAVKRHFQVYNTSWFGWIVESPEVVLNRIFSDV